MICIPLILLGHGNFSIASIFFALSTSVPLMDNRCPIKISSFTIKIETHPVQNNMIILSTLQYFVKIIVTIIERSTTNIMVIHHYPHIIFTKISKYSSHASLESSRRVTQTRIHSSISKCFKRRSEGCLFVIILVDESEGNVKLHLNRKNVSF